MLEELAANAVRLPAWFRPESADKLDSESFTAWTRARDAHAILEAVRTTLGPLYGSMRSDFVAADALAALRYIAPPSEFTDVLHAHRFARALAGTRHGGSDLGELTIQGVFAPTACAELGGRFEWATPAEVARRVEAITAAATPPVVERKARVYA